MAELTDLEAAALGCVARYGPCTAHFIRTRFRDSPSPQFSDSAGSIYPMMRRLLDQGFVARTTRHDGRRDVDDYRCTSTGRAALKRWLGPPIPSRDGITIDPLRTKIICLSLLTTAKRQVWIDSAQAVLRERLKEIEEKIVAESTESAGDIFMQLAHENARMEIQARLRWIELVRKRLQ